MTLSLLSAPILVVLIAALLHAAWNAMAHGVSDQLLGFAVIGVAYTVGSAVVLPFVGVPAAASWPYLATSVVLHIGYVLLLMAAYRLGDFGQTYPLARGTSPWVVAVLATVVVGEALPPLHLAGVLAISVGLLALVFAGGRPGRRQLPALFAAFGTGLLIAAYTVVDGIGVRLSGSVPGYAGWLFLLQGPVIPLIAVLVRRRTLTVRSLRRIGPIGLLGGALSLLAYGLVLWAQTRGTLATVAAVRETSIIFGAAIATMVFRERFGGYRVAAAVLTVAGIALLST